MKDESARNARETGAATPKSAATEGPMVSFGALVDSLSIQLESQGFTVSDHAELMRIEVIAKAVATVTIHGLMPPAMSDRARRKLVKRLMAIVRPLAAAREHPSPRQVVPPIREEHSDLHTGGPIA